jgi:hypothetical protein
MNPGLFRFHFLKMQWCGAERDLRRGGYREGETSGSLNPMNGFGMKQGRREKGGTRRQEVEKT